MSIELVILSNHLICHPLLLLPSVFPSIRVFSNELALSVKCQKYWAFSINTSSSSEYSGFISFRIDWFDLFAVQRTPPRVLWSIPSVCPSSQASRRGLLSFSTVTFDKRLRTKATSSCKWETPELQEQLCHVSRPCCPTEFPGCCVALITEEIR